MNSTKTDSPIPTLAEDNLAGARDSPAQAMSEGGKFLANASCIIHIEKQKV